MTIPNILTLLRVAIIPIVVVLLIAGESDATQWWAFYLFVASAMTDFFDGWLARKLNQESDIGRLFDPIADKLLIASVLLVLVGIDRISGLTVLAAAVILCREILVSGLREFLAEVPVRVPVTTMAKWKTTMQMLALGFLLVGPVGPDFGPLTTTEVGIWGIWGAALLTLVTGYDYLIAGLKHIVETDHAPADKHPHPPEDSKEGENH